MRVPSSASGSGSPARTGKLEYITRAAKKAARAFLRTISCSRAAPQVEQSHESEGRSPEALLEG